MASAAEVRAWAAANGHPELAGGRGRIPDDIRAGYDAAHAPADDYGPGTSEDDFGGDLGYVAADEPPLVEDEPLGGGETAGAAAAEERPSRPHATRPRFGFRKPKTSKGKGKRPGKTFRRVSIAPLIEDAYSDLAWAAGGIPPLSRLLYAQAPIAGAILDPVVKDTVADRVVLQPAARHYEQLKVGMALLGTPASLMAVLATAPGPAVGEDGQPLLVPVIDQMGQPVMGEDGTVVMAYQMAAPSVQHQTAMLSLRYGVRAMVDIAGDGVQRVQERAQKNEDRDRLVNEFIAFLLDAPLPESTEETAARKARDAGLKLAGVGQ